jgi:predicted nucleic acid-binding protein
MCIIIDTNTLAHVFNKEDKKHNEFIDVFYWIIEGNGKVVYGGTKYIEELSRTKFLKLFRYLNTNNKAIFINSEKVDSEQKKIQKLISDKDFDDPHLPAMVIVSKCRLICSYDKRSIKFVTNKELYPKKYHIPKYYTGKRNKNLLSDDNIDDCYKPLCKLTKEQSAALTNII